MIVLRDYQQAAVDSVYKHLESKDTNPVVVIPTAGGKTPIIVSMCKDVIGWNGRVLVLAHVKELLTQAVEKFEVMFPEFMQHVGVYSAGLNSRDTTHSVIVAGIQSVYNKSELLGHFDLILVDEVHLIAPEGDGMYRTLLAGMKQINPNIRIVGLTATPFRMSSGAICSPDGWLNEVCYEVGVRELIKRGFISNLVTKGNTGMAEFRWDDLHIRGGEFVASELQDVMNQNAVVESACLDIVEKTQERKSVLIFASGIYHAENIIKCLAGLNQYAVGIYGTTSSDDRSNAIAMFKEGSLKYLVNVNVLTTGFDAPNVDCIALLRPTMSPGLYYQMVGRGFRIAPGKTDCKVLDYSGNIYRHGPVDAISYGKREVKKSGDAPVKDCPECGSAIFAGYVLCPDCGHDFSKDKKVKHSSVASDCSVVSEDKEEWKDVRYVRYSVHTKRGAKDTDPRTMRVEYCIGLNQYQSEWVCLEHTGFARDKAVAWWKRRTDFPVPDNADDAVEYAMKKKCLVEPGRIKVKTIAGERFSTISEYELGPMKVHNADDSFDPAKFEDDLVY